MMNAAAGISADSSGGSLDYALFHAVNGLAGRNSALDALMVGSAKYLPIVFALALVALWFSWRPRNQRGAFLAGVSALVALGLGQIIGKTFPRPRPSQCSVHGPCGAFAHVQFPAPFHIELQSAKKPA